MKRRYKITSKVRFTMFIAIALLSIITVAGTLMGMNTANSLSMNQYNQVEIKSGDTLWQIASEYAPDNKDIRRVVYDICEINDITAEQLQSGQKILVPVYS